MRRKSYVVNYSLASLAYLAEQVLIKWIGGFRGGSPIRLLPDWAEAKMVQPSTRCDIRILGETLIEAKSGMPSKPRGLARTLIPEETDISETVRRCLVLCIRIIIKNRDYALILELGLYCVWWVRTWSSRNFFVD